ncbi:flagellar hook-length control protein FliK [Aliikangiella sp. G2MR2-5]|uniref:flagellar hook-length control protein FliK n=1 Tax=Aliikangiella sp. G2MR2-5 TaxID=2788943 RepID=UPI0018A9947E|nr:flagellar hook-length control protein FliK [Aliikangiella sp. G2MR2-5]
MKVTPNEIANTNSKLQINSDYLNRLISQLDNKILAIQGIIVQGSGSLLLTLESNALISKIAMPQIDKSLSATMLQSPWEIRLSKSGNLIKLEFLNDNFSTKETRLPPLEFRQASVGPRQTLNLTQLVPSANLQSWLKINSGTTEKLTDSSLTVQANKTPSSHSDNIRQIIKLALTRLPRDTQPVAEPISQTLKLLKELRDSLVSHSQTKSITSQLEQIRGLLELFKNQVIKESPSGSSLSQSQKATVLELANKLVSLLDLKQALQQIIRPLDKQDRLSIGHRLTFSGNFMESRMSNIATSTNSSSPSEVASSNLKFESTSAFSSQVSPVTDRELILPNQLDLKAISGKLKLLAENLLHNMMLTKSQPLQLENIIREIANLPALRNWTTTTSFSPPVLESSHFTNVAIPGSVPQTPQHFLLSQLGSLGLNTLVNLLTGAYIKANDRVGAAAAEKSVQSQQISILNRLLTSSEAITHKIETNQLLSVRSESVGIQQLLFDLPIYHAGAVDSFEVLFKRNRTKKKKEIEKNWSVTIRFELEPLGPMFARVQLAGERISAHFFAQDESTAKLIVEHLDKLKDSLNLAGVKVDELKGQVGIVPEKLLVDDEQKIDLKA